MNNNVELKTKNEKLLTLILKTGLFTGLVLFAPTLAQAATLSLSPTSGTYEAGKTFEVKILLDTSGVTTSGTDAYVRYDPNVLEVVDANASAEGTQILPGSLYSQTSYNQVADGKISFSGSKSGGSPGYAGSGTLATITFQALKDASSTAVNFDFTSGSTTDSNVINQSNSSDVLSSVTNAKYTVTPDTSTGDDGSDSSSSGSGAGGKSGSDGSGGSGDVAGTGIDLYGYMALTLLSLIGAGYFLTRKSKRN